MNVPALKQQVQFSRHTQRYKYVQKNHYVTNLLMSSRTCTILFYLHFHNFEAPRCRHNKSVSGLDISLSLLRPGNDRRQDGWRGTAEFNSAPLGNGPVRWSLANYWRMYVLSSCWANKNVSNEWMCLTLLSHYSLACTYLALSMLLWLWFDR